jgi:hypothetical protein
MTAEAILFDPEFEGLLREAAAQPGSCLLKVPRPKVLRGLFERDEPISARASELSKVERHLVQVYRCEIAWLLRQACLIKLIDGPRSRLYVCRYRTVEKEYQRLKPEQLASHVEVTRGDERQTLDIRSAIELLALCTADPSGAQPTVAHLAALSCRLVPTDHARVLAAMDLSQNRSPRTAVRCLVGVLEHSTTEAIVVSAQCNLGFAYASIGDLPSAHRHYSWACRLDSSCISPWMSRLCFGLQLGLLEDVQRCSRWFDEVLPIDHPALTTFVRSHTQQRHERSWSPTRESQRLLAKLSSSLGPAAGRIADVFR